MSKRNQLAANLELKEIDEEGHFEGIASIFNKVDLGGDMILPGAYKKTLADMKAQKRIVPFLWRHMQEEVMGGFHELVETKKGLEVKGQIVPDLSDYSQKAYLLMKTGLARGLSIGYRVMEGCSERIDGIRKIKSLELFEISFTPVAMDPYANVTSVKTLSDIRAKLAAGDRLTSREWELVLKEQCTLTNSEAERAVRINLKKGSGAPGKSNGGFDLRAELAELKTLISNGASPQS